MFQISDRVLFVFPDLTFGRELYGGRDDLGVTVRVTVACCGVVCSIHRLNVKKSLFFQKL